ncbi:MAG: glutathione S-transferase [Gammaproteobacteria bacterium]|nr:glutathione S-transferase [Rhodocyclaceae bacterium]MBU3909594.1 glutathione S-transferase [Gammaproteobacteria bacterium]MBU3989154.1 glutathione S-transferase [Gammaproteobacteria bacterium]MBU4003257.1 glutathione S-transferase [Gammaproteobacteria bacterium]MBU4022306.1 glutathione S-transferase [Gammaproteobacteria bacterium]
MKLLGTFTSPYVRKTRIVLAEKKIDCEFVLNSPWVEGSSVSQHNPLGKIPVLIFDDNSTLFDSRVIVEYLDNLAPNNRLIPATGRERIQVRRWEALADGICDAAAAAFLEAKREGAQKSQSWIDRQRGKIVLGLAASAADLGEHPWCHGNAITLADIALGTALGYLLFRFPDIDWQTQHPNLTRLYDKLMHRQSFIDTVPHD